MGSLSTHHDASYPAPRKTRFQVLVRLSWTGFNPQGSDERFLTHVMFVILLSQACLAQSSSLFTARRYQTEKRNPYWPPRLTPESSEDPPFFFSSQPSKNLTVNHQHAFNSPTNSGEEPFFYTTCPNCAKHYGKNYVVILAQI